MDSAANDGGQLAAGGDGTPRRIRSVRFMKEKNDEAVMVHHHSEGESSESEEDNHAQQLKQRKGGKRGVPRRVDSIVGALNPAMERQSSFNEALRAASRSVLTRDLSSLKVDDIAVKNPFEFGDDGFAPRSRSNTLLSDASDMPLVPRGMRLTTSRHVAIMTELHDTRNVADMIDEVAEQEADLVKQRKRIYDLEKAASDATVRENILLGRLKSRKNAISILRTTLWQDLCMLRVEIRRIEPKEEESSPTHQHIDDFSYLDAFRLLEEENDDNLMEQGSRRVAEIFRLEHEFEKRRIIADYEAKVQAKDAELIVARTRMEEAIQVEAMCEAKIEAHRIESDAQRDREIAAAAAEAAEHLKNIDKGFHAEIDRKEEAIADLKLQIKELEMLLESGERNQLLRDAKVHEVAKERNASLEARIRELEAAASTHDEALEASKLKFQKMVKDKSTVELQLSQEQQKCESVSEILEKTLERERELRADLDTHKARVYELSNENRRIEKTLKAIETEKEIESRRFDRSMNTQQEALIAASKQNEELAEFWKEEADAYQAEAERNNEHATKMREERNEMEAEVSELKSQIERTEQERRSENAAYELLKARVDTEEERLQFARDRVRPMQRLVAPVVDNEIENARFYLEQLVESVGDSNPTAGDFVDALARHLARIKERVNVGQMTLISTKGTSISGAVSDNESTPRPGGGMDSGLATPRLPVDAPTLPKMSGDRSLQEMITFEYGPLTDSEIAFVELQEELIDKAGEDAAQSSANQRALREGRVGDVFQDTRDDSVDWDALRRTSEEENATSPKEGRLDADALKELQKRISRSPSSRGLQDLDPASLSVKKGPGSVRSRRSKKSVRSIRRHKSGVGSEMTPDTSAANTPRLASTPGARKAAANRVSITSSIVESPVRIVTSDEFESSKRGSMGSVRGSIFNAPDRNRGSFATNEEVIDVCDAEQQTYVSWVTDSQLGFVPVESVQPFTGTQPENFDVLLSQSTRRGTVQFADGLESSVTQLKNRKASFSESAEGAEDAEQAPVASEWALERLRQMGVNMSRDTVLGAAAVGWFRHIDSSVNTDATGSIGAAGLGLGHLDLQANPSLTLDGTASLSQTNGLLGQTMALFSQGDDASMAAALSRAAAGLGAKGRALLETMLGAQGFNVGAGGGTGAPGRRASTMLEQLQLEPEEIPQVFTPESIQMALSYVYQGVSRLRDAIALSKRKTHADAVQTSAATALVNRWFGDASLTAFSTNGGLVPFHEAFTDDASVQWLYSQEKEFAGNSEGVLVGLLEMRIFAIAEALADQRMSLGLDGDISPDPSFTRAVQGERERKQHRRMRDHLRDLVQEHRGTPPPELLDDAADSLAGGLTGRSTIITDRPPSGGVIPTGVRPLTRPTSAPLQAIREDTGSVPPDAKYMGRPGSAQDVLRKTLMRKAQLMPTVALDTRLAPTTGASRTDITFDDSGEIDVSKVVTEKGRGGGNVQPRSMDTESQLRHTHLTEEMRLLHTAVVGNNTGSTAGPPVVANPDVDWVARRTAQHYAATLDTGAMPVLPSRIAAYNPELERSPTASPEDPEVPKKHPHHVVAVNAQPLAGSKTDVSSPTIAPDGIPHDQLPKGMMSSLPPTLGGSSLPRPLPRQFANAMGSKSINKARKAKGLSVSSSKPPARASSAQGMRTPSKTQQQLPTSRPGSSQSIRGRSASSDLMPGSDDKTTPFAPPSLRLTELAEQPTALPNESFSADLTTMTAKEVKKESVSTVPLAGRSAPRKDRAQVASAGTARTALFSLTRSKVQKGLVIKK